MQQVASFTLEMTALYAVIGLEATNERFDGLAPFEQLPLLFADPLGLPPMHDVHQRVVSVHTLIAQIHEGRCWSGCAVLDKDRCLLQLLGQGVAVVRVAVECTRANDQGAPKRAGNAHLHPELVGRSRLALADAVDLGRVPCVALGLSIRRVLAAMGHDAPVSNGMTRRACA